MKSTNACKANVWNVSTPPLSSAQSFDYTGLTTQHILNTTSLLQYWCFGLSLHQGNPRGKTLLDTYTPQLYETVSHIFDLKLGGKPSSRYKFEWIGVRKSLTEDLSSPERIKRMPHVNPTKCMMNYDGKPSFITHTVGFDQRDMQAILREIIREVSCKTRSALGATYSLMAVALRERSLQRVTRLPVVRIVCGVVLDGWVRIWASM